MDSEVEVTGKTSGRRRSFAEITGVITDRDLECLAWVISQGVMTGDQIYRAIYEGSNTKSSRYAYKRIQFLESSGYLESIRAPHKRDRFLKGTRAALRLLSVKNYPDLPGSLCTPTISEFPHAEVLTDIRIAILKSGRHSNGLWWRGEGVLLQDSTFPKERFRDLLPDALWTTKGGQRIAIEFERARKGITRVRKKVEALDQELRREDRVFDMVLWVAVDGSYRDLKLALQNRDTQVLRSIPEFLSELKNGGGK